MADLPITEWIDTVDNIWVDTVDNIWATIFESVRIDTLPLTLYIDRSTSYNLLVNQGVDFTLEL